MALTKSTCINSWYCTPSCGNNSVWRGGCSRPISYGQEMKIPPWYWLRAFNGCLRSRKQLSWIQILIVFGDNPFCSFPFLTGSLEGGFETSKERWKLYLGHKCTCPWTFYELLVDIALFALLIYRTWFETFFYSSATISKGNYYSFLDFVAFFY